jgi:hypothetical protein
MSFDSLNYDLYTSNDVVLFINGERLQHIERIEIHESIFSSFKYGLVHFTDKFGEIEFLEIYGGNTICEIRIANAFEETPKVFYMKIIDVKRNPIESRSSNRKMNTIFNIVEYPLYQLLFDGKISKSWRDATAMDIVSDIFPPSIIGDNFNSFNFDEPTFRFNRFISPFWNRSKILKYLKYYSDDGPFLFYSQYDEITRKYILNYKSLQNLISGQSVRTLTASTKQTLNTYSNNYTIKFPTWLDMISIMQGERVYNFQFTEGDRTTIQFPHTGDYTYNSDSDQYLDAISSEYLESVKRTESNSQTNSFYSDFNNNLHNVSIDVDPKDAVKAKMASRFFEKYHNQMEVLLTIPPFSETKIGDSFDINLPTFNEDITNIEDNKDDKLSGKFLLKKMSHIIYMSDTNVQRYQVNGTFVRTGYSTAVEDEELKS